MFSPAALNLPATGRTLLTRGGPDRVQAYAVFCAVSFICYIAAMLTEGPGEALFTLIGVGACGWAWLLTRALFDAARHDVRWPRIVVFVIAITGAVSVLAPVGGIVARVADNAYALSGSAALLMTFVEPFQTRGLALSAPEKRFRITFLAVYSVLIVVTILGLGGFTGLRDDLIKGACALVGLVASGAAIWFRRLHPLPECKAPVRRPPTAEDKALAERLMRLLRDEAIDAEPDLKIGDVARRLGQPEYKLSQCISTALGFPNFNRLINHHRIARARRLLVEAGRERPILDVAFECGFGSVGPFNRAFKAEVGMTPRAFRKAAARDQTVARE